MIEDPPEEPKATKETAAEKKAREAKDMEDEAVNRYREAEEMESRVNELRVKIMKQEDRNIKYLQRQFFKAENFDPTSGRCCGCNSNRKGVKVVMWIDLLLFFNLIRFFTALTAMKNFRQFPNYAKARQITFYF